jgi:hypothetical protein
MKHRIYYNSSEDDKHLVEIIAETQYKSKLYHNLIIF